MAAAPAREFSAAAGREDRALYRTSPKPLPDA
jgi:hypothetical protein